VLRDGACPCDASHGIGLILVPSGAQTARAMWPAGARPGRIVGWGAACARHDERAVGLATGRAGCVAIRHLDHISSHRAGGPASLVNGRGVCARGNYVREMPGCRVELVHDGLGRQPHTVRTTTPTGHTYAGRAGLSNDA
jgi:hypothetical protein